MIRLLHISVRSDIGGGPKHVISLMQGLREVVYSFVAIPREGELFSEMQNLCHGVFVLPNRRFSVRSLCLLAKWVKSQRIELIHSHGRGAGIYSRLLGILLSLPVIHTHHGLYLEKSFGVRRLILVGFERILNYLTCHVIFVSQSELEGCSNVGAAPLSKSTVIPNGIDINCCIREFVSCAFLKLLVVTRLSPEKNNIRLVEIAKLLCNSKVNFHMTVIGDGPEKGTLMTMLTDENISDHVTLLGAVKDVKRFIVESDIYLTTSLGEGNSIAMLEAMAAGLVVVASNVRGHTDVITDGENGYLFNLDDIELAAEIIQRLSLSCTDLARCGARARQTVVKSHTSQMMLCAIFGVYRRVLP